MKPLLILFFSLSTLIAAAQDTQIHPNTPGTSKNAAPHEAMFPGGLMHGVILLQRILIQKQPKKIMHHRATTR